MRYTGQADLSDRRRRRQGLGPEVWARGLGSGLGREARARRSGPGARPVLLAHGSRAGAGAPGAWPRALEQ